jgi:amidophosphoribosyltransferase
LITLLHSLFHDNHSNYLRFFVVGWFAQVCAKLGADGLIYQTVEDLVAVGRGMNPDIAEFDTSCFTGTYVTGTTPEYLQSLEETSGRGNGRRSGQKASLIGAS